MTQYTVQADSNTNTLRVFCDGEVIAKLHGQAQEHAERIVACLEYCASYPTHGLIDANESGGLAHLLAQCRTQDKSIDKLKTALSQIERLSREATDTGPGTRTYLPAVLGDIARRALDGGSECAHVRAPLDAQCLKCGAKMPLRADETYNAFGTVVKR